MEIAWRAVDEAERLGRGGLERAAQAFGVNRAVVMEAIDRVERSFGGHPFFVVRVRRTGEITPAGRNFHGGGQVLLSVWRGMHRSMQEHTDAGARSRSPAT
jgi:DNA-binding transcriptional LysR family regulator